MIKRFYTLSLILFVSFSYAQKSAPKTFPVKIEGELRNSLQKHLYIHHQEDGTIFSDSIAVKNRNFKFQSKLTEPGMFWITLSRDATQQNNLVFFVDEAPVKVVLFVGDSLIYSTAEAGQAQKDYMEYKTMINNFVLLQQRMQNDFTEASQKGDNITQMAIRNEFENLNQQYLLGLKNFIKSHPKSAMSAYILNNDLNNANIPISEVEEALAYIDASLNQNSNVAAAKQRIDDKRGTTVGYAATNFSQADPNGKMVQLKDFRGKYVLVDFWASWCRPCRMENPNVVMAYNKFKAKGFTVLGVSMDSNRDAWLAAIQQDQLAWTQLSDLKGWGNEVGKKYGVTGIPANYLIDKEGKIIAKDLRGPALEEKLAEVLK